uniref:Methyltransferase domain-containing protein n=1 Tax=Setaria digitata TaxID=48799 RepID=A0A915PNZ0_9BILA
MAEHWRHVWQSSEVLGEYLSAHHYLFDGCTVLELGSGCTGIPGLVAAKCGAKLVVFTDHPECDEAFKILQQNCNENGLDENSFLIKDLDWNDSNIEQVLDDVHMLHYILAADVFYDIEVFEALIRTVGSLLRMYQKATCIFAYEERKSFADINCLRWMKAFQIRSDNSYDLCIHRLPVLLI